MWKLEDTLWSENEIVSQKYLKVYYNGQLRQDYVTVWVHIYTSIKLDPVIYHIQQLLSLLV